MAFWIFMLITDLLIPACMIGFGRLFLRRPPKKINRTYGYRWGLLLLPVTVIPMKQNFEKEGKRLFTTSR